jgi:translation initiation factor IF-3
LRTPRINNQIKAKEVRLISEDGKNLAIFPFEKALQYARERSLDLIEVSSSSTPLVCRVMDLGKYLYYQKKKEGKQRKKQKIGKLKSVRISLRISPHDIEVKGGQIKKFLKKGYKVRIEVFLKGREKTLLDFAKDKLKNLFDLIKEEIEIKQESEIKRNPRGLEVTISKK